MDYEAILIKPDELYLKSGPVMSIMMKRLAFNIKIALKENDITFDHILGGRLSLLIRTPEIKETIKILQNLPGISIIMPIVSTGTDLQIIKDTALELLRGAGKKSFAVRVKRLDKSAEITSKKAEEEIGSYLKEKTKKKVNLTKPDVTIYIEINTNHAYLSAKREKGLCGLPVGVSGKVACVVKEDKGFVAPFLMLRRGCEVDLFNFYSDEKKHQKFLINTKKLNKFAHGSKIKVNCIKGPLDFNKLKDYKAVCLDSLNPLLNVENALIFEPLVGLSAAQINAYKKVIFK